MNGILTSFGSTFNDLLSSTFSLQEGVTSCGTKKNKHLTRAIETAVMASIITSTKKDIFVKEIESQYKEFYFKKQRLGEMYELVTSLMATAKAKKEIEKKLSYKERVEKNKTTKQASEEKRTESETGGSLEKDTKSTKYELMTDGSLRPTTSETESSTGTGIYFTETTNDKNADFSETIVVNNVSISSDGATDSGTGNTTSTGGTGGSSNMDFSVSNASFGTGGSTYASSL
jgi:hypothetical protein